MVDAFDFIAFISKKGTLCDGKERISRGQNVECNSRIRDMGSGSHFINGQIANSVHKGFYISNRIRIFFVGLMGGSMHTEIAVNICLRLSGLNLFGRKDFGWFSEVFTATKGGIQTDKRSINDTLAGK
jgi:hypothetical protein